VVGMPEGLSVGRRISGVDKAPRINWWIILKWILRNMVEYGLPSSGSGQGLVAGSGRQGNKPSGCIKAGDFLTR
jgi:hypothetical protein